MAMEATEDLDEILAEILGDGIRDTPSAPQRVEAPSAPTGPRVQEVLHLFYGGAFAQCAEQIQTLAPDERADPRVVALRAACHAMVCGRIEPAIGRCLELLRVAERDPELYGILGTLLARAKRRAEAFAAFRRGLALAPRHAGLHGAVSRLGVRRPPTIALLSRTHPANRFLGRIRSWLHLP